MKKNILLITTFIIWYGCRNDTNNDNITEGCFSISAKNIADNSLINGGKYEILNPDGKSMGIYILETGEINISDFQEGIYTIKEITPPKGYVTDKTQKELQLSSSNCENIVFHYINERTRAIPQSLKLKFYRTDTNELMREYNAVRIGEYYWIDQNFTHIVPWGSDYENSYPITQVLLDKYVERILIDPDLFKLENINNFEKYYGRYYSYPSILSMNKYGQMRNEDDEALDGWRLPYSEDYRQLFAMSPFNTTYDSPHTDLNERDVRFALSAKNGENAMAYNIGSGTYKTYWFDNNTNMYKFNLMPGGARLNGDGQWCNGLGPSNGCYTDGKKGDIYHLFYSARLAVVKETENAYIGTVTIHDLVDTHENLSYHMLNVRWCRRLTDLELGYKLYINQEQTDIVKLDIKESPPSGYKELKHGYIRGFYVQYILNNPNAGYTASDIIKFAKGVQDTYVFNNKNNKEVIL
ncbi:hypothetical protein GGR21_002806 [Dysgonomonas hofstadii]|uniref:SpaA-like prealbumin fold domain-containing protein n=1 Tax=Dysgonomonas hofstadii TaxID=637886 RepID=A0A840CY90_9BACT|nr:prealbumin-like fold domain-containing protein [Dysgonomonas hofstadii]MBB4036893.1 hypothetical protein [Dysgonomonas hofstadii]